MSRRLRTSSIARAVPVLGAAVVVLGALTWPLLFTHSDFAGDWERHLWLMWHQSLAIQSTGFPSLFLNSAYSVFYPTYAFYGGTVYVIGGLLSLALGGAPVSAYVLVYLLDFAAAFGGWYWLARMSGVGRWLAMIPGIVFVSSAYYFLVAYVQGDWPEFTGISIIPLLLAAALSVLRADRLQVGAALALALSSVLFFGSHSITIMLGLTTFVLCGAVVLIAVPAARALVTRRGIARVGGVVVPAACVSGWYLLPALAYHSTTRLGSEYHEAREELRGNVSLVSMAHLFTFSRTTGPGMALPVLAIVWVLAGMLVLPRGSGKRTWVRLLLIFSGFAVLIAVAMTHVGLLLALPRPYTLIQYSYRLEAYVLLMLCAAIVAALVLAGGRSRHAPGALAPRRARAWMWMALPVCAVSLGGAIQQLSAFPYPGQDRYEALQAYGEDGTGNNRDYQDVAEPIVTVAHLASVTIPPEAVSQNRVSFSTELPSGALLATNIGAGPYLLHIAGAKPVGVDAETGDMVLRVGTADGAARAGRSGDARAASAHPSSETISVSAGDGLPIVLGRLLSLLGLAILAVELLALLAHRALARFTPAVLGNARRGEGELSP